MPLFLILSKHWGSSISGAFLLRVEKEASAPALRLRKGNKGSCNNFTEWIPSGLFSGKYVPAVRCNADLLECIGDTLGNKMFGSRIMVRNKMKKRCIRNAAFGMKPDKRFRDSNSKIAHQVFWLGQLLINGMSASCSALYFLLQSGKKYLPMA